MTGSLSNSEPEPTAAVPSPASRFCYRFAACYRSLCYRSATDSLRECPKSGVWRSRLHASGNGSSRSVKPKYPDLSALDRDTCAIGETGFEPATARPPAGGPECSMRPHASPASLPSPIWDLRNEASGTKVVLPRRRSKQGPDSSLATTRGSWRGLPHPTPSSRLSLGEPARGAMRRQFASTRSRSAMPLARTPPSRPKRSSVAEIQRRSLCGPVR